MTWQDHLTDDERRELAEAESARDEAKREYNAVRFKLKNRAEARGRRAKSDD